MGHKDKFKPGLGSRRNVNKSKDDQPKEDVEEQVEPQPIKTAKHKRGRRGGKKHPNKAKQNAEANPENQFTVPHKLLSARKNSLPAPYTGYIYGTLRYACGCRSLIHFLERPRPFDPPPEVDVLPGDKPVFGQFSKGCHLESDFLYLQRQIPIICYACANVQAVSPLYCKYEDSLPLAYRQPYVHLRTKYNRCGHEIKDVDSYRLGYHPQNNPWTGEFYPVGERHRPRPGDVLHGVHFDAEFGFMHAEQEEVCNMCEEYANKLWEHAIECEECFSELA